jgi:endoglucanase
VTPSCFDNLWNQGEQWVDCGGPCAPCTTEETPISVQAYGTENSGFFAHMRIEVNGRSIGESYVTGSSATYAFTAPMLASAVSTVTITLDNAPVYDGGNARNLYVQGIAVDGTPLDLPSCQTDPMIWYADSRITFGWDGDAVCPTGASCTPDCSFIVCGESRNRCGDCGTCATGTCLFGYCVTGPGRLHAEGNQIVDAAGQPVLLKGANYQDQGSGGANDTWYWNRKDKVDLDFLEMAEWGMNSVRMLVSPFSDDYFAVDPEDYMARFLDRQVALCAQTNMYAIIDNHEYYDTDPDTHDRMMNFWTIVSQRYAPYEHVIFELFNEPHQGEWLPLRDLYEEAIDIIRANAPDALIIANGLEWGYDIHYVLTDPVRKENIAYGTHPYPGKIRYCNWEETCMRDGWDAKFGDASLVYPVMVTEVGWFPEPPDSPDSGREWDAPYEAFGVPFLQYLRDRNIGYSILGFTNGFCCNLLQSLDPDYIPSPVGEMILDDMAND